MRYALSEYLTAQFYAWEQRGRGWELFHQPVHLESEFIPFFGHIPPETPARMDTGRRPRFFPVVQEVFGLFKKSPVATFGEEAIAKLDDWYPIRAYIYHNTNPITEFRINVDRDTRIAFDHIEQLLLMLATGEDIVGFEILGTHDQITLQFVCTSRNAAQFKSYLAAYTPGVVITEHRDALRQAITTHQPTWITDLGLRDEFMLPLAVWNTFEPDPLAGCIAALESIGAGELGMLQVLFQSTINPWAESIYRAVTDANGDDFFADAPDMLPLAKEKISQPLFATVVRTVGQAHSTSRACAISQHIAQSLIPLQRAGSNTLIPLSDPPSGDMDDILQRRSRRLGMLLSSGELAGIVHVPDRSVVSPKLRAYVGKTKKAPVEVTGHAFALGTNEHFGNQTQVSLSDHHRLRHMHIIGATGSGKSSLLLNLITQDIHQGRGVAVLDPHGDLIDAVIQYIPDERLHDVVLVDPSDSEYPMGLNLLAAHTESEKILLSSDLVALFKRFATSWGDQMTSVLANAINALLDSQSGGTLIDLRRFLVESGFRNRLLATVEDPNIIYYWQHEFPLLRQHTVAPILTRLDTFLRPKVVRNMMAQKDGLDFRDILNSQKILLVKLAQGLIGEENSYLLGTLCVAKLHQAAQSRQNIAPEARTPFYFYIDEFQHFTTPSMSAILAGARKYGLGLILAHQDLDQLMQRDSELANSVASNPAIRVCFRCGDKDAVRLENGFSYFDATDLQSLKVGQAIVRVGSKDHDFNVSFSLLPKVDPESATRKYQTIVDHCRATYAVPQSTVEATLHQILQDTETPVKSKPAPPKVAEPHQPVSGMNVTSSNTAKPEIDLTTEAQQFVAKEIERERLRDHRFIQEFIKKIAEARNFKAVIEESVNANTGKVDVGLHHNDLTIACEISVTNTPEYEVQNIQKCFTAGYVLVFVISDDSRHLHDIRMLAVTTIAQSLHGRLFFVSKDEFVTHLDMLLAKQSQPAEVRAKGYRVKLNYTGSSDTPGQQKALKDVMLSAMRRKEG